MKKSQIEHLQADTQKWIRGIVSDYTLESHHEKLLIAAGEALDRMHQAQIEIRQAGAYFTSSKGDIRPHPALKIEHDCSIRFARMIRELNLDDSTNTEPRLPRK